MVVQNASSLPFNGVRFGTLGSAADLVIAAPLAANVYGADAGTDATRIGIYFDRTASAEKIGFSVMGVAVADIFDDRIEVLGSVLQPESEKSQPNGYASLDGTGKVPISELPPLGGLIYQGTWNAFTNTPTLTSGVGTNGYYYIVNVAGSTNLDGITDWQVGDWAIFDGTAWQKIDNSSVSGTGTAGQVTFWNGTQTVTGDVQFLYGSGQLTLGDFAASASLGLKTADNQAGTLDFYTATNSARRWSINKGATTHPLNFTAYDATGSQIDIPISIANAAAGLITVVRPLTTDQNVTQTGATTFSTGTGAVSLNGDTTIAAGKQFLLNGTTSTLAHVALGGTMTELVGTTQVGYRMNGMGSSSGTNQLLAFSGEVTTSAAAYTVAKLVQFSATGAITPGAGSTVTRYSGFASRTQTVGGTANFGWYHGSAGTLAGTGTWCLYNDTSDRNYLGSGATLINSTTDDGVNKLQVTGGSLFTGAVTGITSAGVISRQATTQDGMALLGRAGGSSSYVGYLTSAALTTSRTYTFPDADVTIHGGSGTMNQVAYWTSSAVLGSSANLGFDGTNVTLGGNISQTGATTLSTGTGAISLNGDVTLASGKTLLTSGRAAFGQALSAATVVRISTASDLSGTTQTGLQVLLDAVNAGSPTVLRAAAFQVENNPIAGITSMIGARYHNNSNTGSGAATRSAAIHANQQTGGTTSNIGYNYGTNAGLTASSGTWCFYNETSDPNAMGTGATLINSTTDDGANKLQVTGGSMFTGNVMVGTANNLTVGATSSSNVGVVTVASTSVALSGASQYGFYSLLAGSSAATTRIIGFHSAATTAAASFTAADLIQFGAMSTITLGAGSTATRTAEFAGRGRTLGGTFNAVYYAGTSANLTGSGNWNAYFDTTAGNYLGTGTTLISDPTSVTFDNNSTATTVPLQVNGTTAAACSVGISRWTNTSTPPTFFFGKSRGPAVGSYTVVQDGDSLGIITWDGADGTAFRTAAQIMVEVDGTPGASDLPGRILFKTTADGAATSTTAMTLNAAQNLLIGVTAQVDTSERLGVIKSTATTNAVTPGLVLGANSTGTAAAGFGARFRWTLESSTTNNTTAFDDEVSWVVATHASRTARRVMSAYDTAARECLRMEASGSAAMLGFLGASAVVRPTSTTDLRQALIDLGLYTTGGASPLNLNGGALTAGSITTASTTLHTTSVALTDGAGVASGTLLNAPAAGNPTKWIPINDNGTTRYIPAW